MYIKNEPHYVWRTLSKKDNLAYIVYNYVAIIPINRSIVVDQMADLNNL